MTDNMLEIKNLDAFRGTSHILHGVTFNVPANKVTALLGRNGAGKTTTLLAILGMLTSTGTLTWDEGADLASLRTEDRVNAGIGFVPEGREVFTRLTVKENLDLAVRRGSVGNYELVYDLFPILKERHAQIAGSLSGGQQQMISTARALLNPNKLLLVDEPTKGLAPTVVQEVVRALEVAKLHSAILLVEQDLSVANQLADHVVVLGNGEVVFEGSPDAMRSDSNLIHRWIGVDVLATGQEVAE